MMTKVLQSPFLRQQLATLLLHLVTLGAGALGMSHLLDPYMGEVQHTMLMVAGALIAVAAQLYNQYRQKQITVTALKEADLTEHEAKGMVKDPLVATPSVTTPTHVVPA